MARASKAAARKPAAPRRRAKAKQPLPPVPDDSWASSPATRASMLGNRSRDTAPELALRRAVHALGLRYRVAARPLKQVRRTADLVFPTERVAVEVLGCFWHGCPEHFRLPATNRAYWEPKIARNRERDVELAQRLADEGWELVVVWEHDDAAAAAERVREAVVRRRVTGATRTPPPRP
jgi:DNA mismatch endonuclease (patch repair protein)